MDVREEQQARTVSLKACSACSSGLLERDKFCRWCGARQPVREAADECLASVSATVALSTGPRAEVYHRVSAPLVNAVVTGALAGPAIENQSRALKRVILALISVPIWLIIVLLSPLDAYAAVKSLAR
jgi:hypothetical protein